MNDLTIYNVRYGHACNSSSSHSIIWFDGDARTDETADFGWNYFTAADEESRRNYATLLVAGALTPKGMGSYVEDGATWGQSMGDIMRDAALKHMGLEVPEDAYIDHQSGTDIFRLPTSPKGDPAWNFAKEFVEWFTQAPIAVLGGNDNDDQVHPLADDGDPVDFIHSLRGRVRKDPEYGFWTLFNPVSGTKLRLDFTAEGQDVTAPTRASVPELVDLKITDYCPYGCEFCYMDSTTEGVHGDYNYLGNVVSKLAEAGVFEVAMGGGEPTLHPKFAQLCRMIKARGMNANFTTKSLKWLRDPEKAMPIVEACTAFAYSVESVGDMEQAFEAYQPYRRRISMTFQVVVGVVSETALISMLDKAAEYHVPITLLGYKTTGRGSDVKPAKYDWISAVKTSKCRRVGCDTVLAADLVGRDDVPPILYHVHEGAWSMYIDGVERTAAPSSYSDPEASVSMVRYSPYDNNKKWPRCKDIKETFMGMTPEGPDREA